MAGAMSDACREYRRPRRAARARWPVGARRDRRTARRGGDDDDPLSRRQASRRHGLSRYAAGDRMMRALRRIVGALLALLGILVAAPAAEAAGPTCNGKFVNPVTDVCWSCLFPLSVGGLKIWPSGRSEEHTSELQSLMRISY